MQKVQGRLGFEGIGKEVGGMEEEVGNTDEEFA